jgi:hypothetical protein
VALAFLALAALAVVSSLVFAARLDNKKEQRHEASLIAFDSLEEARAELLVSFDSDVTSPRTAHPELSHYFVERTQRLVPEAEEEVAAGALKEVNVIVSWGPPKDHKSYRLMERFKRP